MENIILYVDDAAYARDHLQERLAAHADKVPVGAVHWILVACAPRMTHRISKWVSHSARENWRAKWFAKTLEQLQPLLEQEGSRFTALLATRPLVDMTQQLKLKHGAALVVDARRPKVGVDLEPVAPDQTPPGQSGWVVPSAMAGMGALLILANELSE